MRQPKLLDYILLTLLALIWASAFFNIKIATYSFGPVTIAFLRVFFGAIPVLLLCYFKKIKIEAFSKDWHWFAMIGFINLVAPFFLIAYGVKSVQSNLAAILMSTTPLSSTVLAHFYTKKEKFNFIKTIGILIGFSGIVFLFSDNLLIDENNLISALSAFNGVMVGASGALYGVLVAFAFLFPNARLMLLFPPIPIKAKVLVPLLILGDLFFGFSSYSIGPIAHFAHVSGAVTGLIMIWYWKKNQFDKNRWDL